MAVSNTGTMFKSLTFDGADSRDYGVYITGAGVYNAPQREVEMISIPNRNGSFALDKGRFENIEVTYPAGIYADSETDFADAISEFRNLLCSKNGYCRLTDEYNPNEYRMAIYKSGLDVEPAQLRAGEFDIVFECMPQRYLTSGETEITVSDGQTLTNPTRFDAKPLIKAVGDGSISFNGYMIKLVNETVGYMELADSTYMQPSQYEANPILDLDLNKVADNDTITINGIVAKVVYRFDEKGWSNISYTEDGSSSSVPHTLTHRRIDSKTVEFTLTIPTMEITKAASKNEQFRYNVTITNSSGSWNAALRVDVDYIKQLSEISATFGRLVPTPITTISEQPKITGYSVYIEKIDVTSTQTSLGDPTYIDCEQGEAYKYVDGVYTGINNYVSIGAELPTLAPGDNTITKSGTITSLKIVPRWWRV